MKAYLRMDGMFLVFSCPGCKQNHTVNVKEDAGRAPWQWNGSLDTPTLTPSVLAIHEKRCHSFITDGQIRFLSDCTHNLAGQTVDLPHVDPWPWDRIVAIEGEA